MKRRKDPPRPDEQPSGTCDWGFCDEEAVAWRVWGRGAHVMWIPVCRDHQEPR